MYLKRLELQGFKSFAGRTVLEFGPGMTAIVGPNGSGKSNVADAIRWALGEQSARSVRAKKVEDVIFAGSSKRPAAGLAEVSLVFDNTDGWLPIDFAEVVVTRRAYRSGESEYLLNRNRVRLRDVLDLLLKANVAQDSYAIMGQGTVEAVLGLRAEDRRVLVEEAAGVRPHRARMDEATDRLAATRENLDRVGMLIDEIAPRIGQLERQAQRAEDAGKLARELSAALQEWYTLQWQESQDALVSARARSDQAQEAYRAGAERAATLERHVAIGRDELETLRAEIARREQEHSQSASELRDLERTEAVDAERMGLLTVRLEEVGRDVTTLERDLSHQTGFADEDAERRRHLEEELRVAQASLAERQAELETFERGWADSRAAAAEAQERAARAAAAAGEIEQRLRQHDAEAGRLDTELQRLEARKAALDADIAAVAEDEVRLVAEEGAITAALDEAGRQESALKRLVVDAEAALIELDARYRDASREAALAGGRLEALRVADAERDSIESGLRSLTEDDGDIEGIIGMLTSLIQVPRGMERPIEAALSEYVRAVVVERPDDAFAAIRQLIDSGRGNVTVIPVTGLRDVSPLNLLKEKGIVGVASKLVRCDSKYRRLVDTLLGRTIVVEDARIAREVLKRGLGSVVTMDGVLMRVTGALSLGPGIAIESHFVRDSALRELPEQIAALEESVAGLAEQMEAKRRAVHANRTAITTISQKVETLRTARAAKLDEVTTLRGRLAQLRGELRWVVDVVHQNRQRVEALAAEKETMRTECDAQLARAEETAAALVQQSSVSSTMQQQRESLMRAVSEEGAHAASLEGEYRSIVQLRESQESAGARLEAQLSAKRLQAGEIEAELAQVAARAAATRAAVAALRATHDTRTTELAPLAQRRHELDDSVARLREEHALARQRAIETEHEQRETAAEVERCELELDRLREAIAAEGLIIDGRRVAVEGAARDPHEGQQVPAFLRREPEQGRLPPIAGGAETDATALKERIGELRDAIRKLGPVNAEAITDYEQNRERYEFLVAQVEDLRNAETSLRTAIAELGAIISEEFKRAFDLVAAEFSSFFTQFFGGGKAELVLSPPEDYATSGIDIIAQPPGKKLQSLSLLSGGERALTAVALLFSLLKVRPVPFVMLDEVDAALDEANVRRFNDGLAQLTTSTQFIVVTHNRRTIERGDVLYGVTMGDDSVSRILSLQLSDLPPNLN